MIKKPEKVENELTMSSTNWKKNTYMQGPDAHVWVWFLIRGIYECACPYYVDGHSLIDRHYAQ